MKTLGRHLLGELIGCKVKLDGVPFIKSSMEEAAIHANATIIESVFHQFSPHGVSGVVVIAESHLTIHTWPELNYAAVDVFTCGDTVDPWKAFNFLKDLFKAEKSIVKEITRGHYDLLNNKVNPSTEMTYQDI